MRGAQLKASLTWEVTATITALNNHVAVSSALHITWIMRSLSEVSCGN